MLLSRSSFAVPPEPSSVQRRSRRPLAKSRSPVLLWTERIAVGIEKIPFTENDSDLDGNHRLQSIYKKLVFGLMDTRFERLQSVITFNRNNLRREYRTVVHTFVGDEMNHHAGMANLIALIRIEGSFDRMST